MITRKMRLSMAMLTIAASVLTTGNIKADEKDTTKETNTATESKYANKAVADIYSTTTLNIRKKGSINAKIVGKMKKGNIATVLKKGSEWSKVRSGNVTGYVKNQYLVFGDEIKNFAKQNVKKVAKVQTETLRVRKKASVSISSSGSSATGSRIASYAQQFVGNPYRYGGNSLTGGIDCSGFTQQIMAKFGYSISRTSSSQSGDGRAVSTSNLRVGDLVFYGDGGSIDHVALYIGGGQVVHASNSAPYPRGGIKISNVNYRTPICARRIIG